MTLCSICHRDLPIAVDETAPTADELTVDARGVVRPGAYVCGACLDAAEDELEEARALAATVTDDGAEERQMTNTIPAELIEVLPRGMSIDDCTITTCGALRVEFDVDKCVDDDAPAILLPGWFADDGNAEIHYPSAESGEAVAQEYVDDGDWGERTSTDWIDVWAWRRAYALDEDGEVVTLALDRERHTIELPPDEPECSEGREHDWHERGVGGHGGGVIITEVCAHCGRYMIIDTWAQRRDTGEQGLRSVEYREADEISREWAEERRLDAADGRLAAAGYDTRLDRERRVVVVSLGEIDDDGAEDAVDTVEGRLGDDYIVTWSRDEFGDVTLHIRVA